MNNLLTLIDPIQREEFGQFGIEGDNSHNMDQLLAVLLRNFNISLLATGNGEVKFIP